MRQTRGGPTRRRVPPQLINYPGSPADLSAGVKGHKSRSIRVRRLDCAFLFGMANSGGLEPDTAASAAAVNQSPGVPIVPEQWGGLEPDTAASAAAVIQLSGVPIVLEQWGGRMPDTAMSIAAVNQLPGVPIDKVNGVKCSLWVQVLGYAIYKNDLSVVFYIFSLSKLRYSMASIR